MEKEHVTFKGFITWGFSATLFAYLFLLRTVIGTYQNPVMSDLELNVFEYSLVTSAAFLIVYGIMQIPAGFIIKRIGLRRSLLVASSLAAISSFLFSYSQNFGTIVLSRMLLGFATAFSFISLFISVHEWMPRERRALFIGLSQFIGTMGPILAAGPIDQISQQSDLKWRSIFYLLSAVGVLFTLMIFITVRDREKGEVNEALLISDKDRAGIRKILKNFQPWAIAMLTAILYFVVEYLTENEGRAFLQLKGIPAEKASYVITTSWIGYAIGCPIVGFISDYVRKRRDILVITAMGSFLILLLILHFPSVNYIPIEFFLLGFCASGQSIGLASTMEYFPKGLVAVGLGLNNTMITLLTTINAPLIGYILDKVSGNATLTLNNYLFAFNLLLFTALSGVFIALFGYKETYYKRGININNYGRE